MAAWAGIKVPTQTLGSLCSWWVLPRGTLCPGSALTPVTTLSLLHALPCVSHQKTSQLKLLQALDHPAAVILLMFDTAANEGLKMLWETLGKRAWEIMDIISCWDYKGQIQKAIKIKAKALTSQCSG